MAFPDISAFETLLNEAITFLPKLVAAILIFVVGLWLAGLAASAVRKTLQMRDTDHELTVLLARLTRWGLITLFTVTALARVDFDLTGFVAGLGIVGFTIGFALQDVSKNFVSGVLLLLDQPFDIGDFIKVNDQTGTVMDVSVRATELKTLDGVQVLIPNGAVYTATLTNYGRATVRRLDVSVGVAYDTDLDHATEVIASALSAMPGVVDSPEPPAVVFNNFSASSIDATAYYWVNLNEVGFLVAQDQGIKRVKRALDAAGIEIPFSTHTVLLANAA